MSTKEAIVYWDDDSDKDWITTKDIPSWICEIIPPTGGQHRSFQISGPVDRNPKDIAFEAMDVLEAKYPGEYHVVVMDFADSDKQVLSYDGVKYTWLNS